MKKKESCTEIEGCIIGYLFKVNPRKEKRAMNEIKWLGSFVLLAALLMIIPSTSASTVFYTDGFESYDLGYDPDPPAVSIADSGNWAFVNGDNTAGVVDTKYYSGSQSYSLGSTTASSASMVTTDQIPAGATDIVINCKVYLGDVDSGDNFLFRPTGYYYGEDNSFAGRIELRASGTTNKVGLRYYTDGGHETETTIQESEGAMGTWLDITLTFHSTSKKYDYSIVDTSNSTVLRSRTDIPYYDSEVDVNRAYFSSGRYGSTSANQRHQYIDDLTVSGVPEPATLLLLAGGSLGMLLRRKRG
jgi:hypothetical protein